MNDMLNSVAAKFKLDGTIKSVAPLGEGFINDTFYVETNEAEAHDYLLQRKNKYIFQNIPAMMDNISKVTTHLKKKIIEAGGDPLRQAMTVVPTIDGKLYYKDPDDEYWATCIFIKDNVTYQAARTPKLAFQGGKGIGMFQAMTSDMKEPLTDILPGFHNIRFRLKQWDEILGKNPAGRKDSLSTEIKWIEDRRDEMLNFWELVENGTIPIRVTHNDTKINNILFDKSGNVLCVIDLDTVLNSTVLNDYGDAIRSYTNTGLEDDPNLDNVKMDFEIFKAYTEGYLSETSSFLTQPEIDNLAFSAKYITFEQVLRFLMDYIDGDHYYKIKSPDHNLIRTRAQYKLLLSIENNYPKMVQFIASSVKAH